MYTALLLVILWNGQPVTLQDTRGPYQTEAECKQRAAEMELFARTTVPARYVTSTCKHDRGV